MMQLLLFFFHGTKKQLMQKHDNTQKSIRNENRFRFNSLRLFVVKDDHLETMTSFVFDLKSSFKSSSNIKATEGSLPVLCPTFAPHFLTEMGCGRFARFCSGSDFVAQAIRWLPVAQDGKKSLWRHQQGLGNINTLCCLSMFFPSNGRGVGVKIWMFWS